MNLSDGVAVASFAIAVVALVLSIWNRRQDQEIAAAADARSKVLQLLVTSDAGIRSVATLGDTSDAAVKDPERLEYLRRTAAQLRAVGEIELADSVGTLCHSWTSADADYREKLRSDFLKQVQARFTPD